MSFKIREIIEGWRNHLIPPESLKDLIEKTSNERLHICRNCDFDSKVAEAKGTYNGIRPDEHCLNCGCPLITKTKCLSCSCPLSKWVAIATEKEESEISKIIKNGNS